MNSRFVLRLVCSALAVLVLLALATEAQDMNGPPERPKVFRNPEELRDYLKALNEYFAIVGRPRFGRSVLKRSLSAFRRGHSSYSDLDLEGYQSIRPYELEYYLNGYLKK